MYLADDSLIKLPLRISGFVQVSAYLEWLLTVQKDEPLRYLDLVCTSLFPYVGLDIFLAQGPWTHTLLPLCTQTLLFYKKKSKMLKKKANKRNNYLLPAF